jgi:hypothetical protein
MGKSLMIPKKFEFIPKPQATALIIKTPNNDNFFQELFFKQNQKPNWKPVITEISDNATAK